MAKNKTGLPTGTYVNRSTYQKVYEENKRLKADIFQILEKPNDKNSLDIINKWKAAFEEQRQFRSFQFQMGSIIRQSLAASTKPPTNHISSTPIEQ